MLARGRVGNRKIIILWFEGHFLRSFRRRQTLIRIWENLGKRKQTLIAQPHLALTRHGCSRFFPNETLFPGRAEDAAFASLMHFLVVLKGAHESA